MPTKKQVVNRALLAGYLVGINFDPENCGDILPKHRGTSTTLHGPTGPHSRRGEILCIQLSTSSALNLLAPAECIPLPALSLRVASFSVRSVANSSDRLIF
jgi:hypothetical protein